MVSIPFLSKQNITMLDMVIPVIVIFKNESVKSLKINIFNYRDKQTDLILYVWMNQLDKN